MNMKAEMGVILLQAKEPQGSPAKPQKLERGLGQCLPHSFRRNRPCQHVGLGLLASRTVGRSLLFQLPSPCTVLWWPQYPSTAWMTYDLNFWPRLRGRGRGAARIPRKDLGKARIGLWGSGKSWRFHRWCGCKSPSDCAFGNKLYRNNQDVYGRHLQAGKLEIPQMPANQGSTRLPMEGTFSTVKMTSMRSRSESGNCV